MGYANTKSLELLFYVKKSIYFQAKYKFKILENDQEIEFQEIAIHIFHEIESFCKIVHEIEKALLGHNFRFFSLLNLT